MWKMLRKLWLTLRCCSRKWNRGTSLWLLSVCNFSRVCYLISSSSAQVVQLVLACLSAPDQPWPLVVPLGSSSRGFWLELCWSMSLRCVIFEVLQARVAKWVLGNRRNVNSLSCFRRFLYVGSPFSWSVVRICYGLELCIPMGCRITSGNYCSSNYSELLAK